ncbi:MAG: hypothetical protein BGO43_08550 [Gammaproteobacteria bacterium 39-13]|nr:pseudouridine synthase [Gammaproteobacteria bacterium]OJV94297.1 MAG: hypothetical protein BGO43_08550 [Gammaproteobacteria bacterium 39-13]
MTRLHKLLANAGVGSRRTIESWIRAGKIQVNGKCAQIGQEVTIHDRVHVDGKLIDLEHVSPQQPRFLIYNKPEGEICSTVSEEGKSSVFDSLPPLDQGRWVMVGRLDVNTSGLLLFTNNGELAHQLMHPSFQVERQYAVRVLGQVTSQTLLSLKKGVELQDGEMSRFKDVVPRNSSTGANQWFNVTLSQGKYREVRQLWEAVGCTVSRLIRIKYGSISLPRELKKGKWQELPLGRVEELVASFKAKKLVSS